MKNETKIEPRRYDGPLPEVAKLVKSSKADKTKLMGLIAEYGNAQEQIEEVARLNETLPEEINQLLKSGRMDNDTVEKLARKRAHLDLLPARLNHLHSLLERFEKTESDGAHETIKETVHAAACMYHDVQLKKATDDLMRLGVDEAVARRQALLREEFCSGRLHPTHLSAQYNCGDFCHRIRCVLWFFASFEIGLHPTSPDSAEIKNKWLPGE
jgi:DNA-directed RNA polymerase subunit F